VKEIAFILNAYHALRLVERFDAQVSVELHTDLANDSSASVAYGRRYFQICPERFIIKVPLTPEGLVAAARLGQEGVPVNFTLGFSARQNLMITLLSRPKYCNVFLGRLNQVAADNQLSDGQWIGERAVAASQAVVAHLRRHKHVETLQIAASLRSGSQVAALAGVDVMTIPPKSAQEFQDSGQSPPELRRGIEDIFRPTFNTGISPGAYAFDTLWEVAAGLSHAIEHVSQRDAASLTGMDIQEMVADAGYSDLLPFWSDQDVRRVSQDGKIPKLALWRDRLATGEIGLDALMTLSALQSFAADQQAMDDRIREHIS
jgi:transaldolase